MKRNIVIGLSWPYANNFLHLGHLSSSVPADVLARYHRMAGDEVLLVSGTDSHGTKIEQAARQQKVRPIDVVNKFHDNFVANWDAYSFTFDLFSKTADEYHAKKCAELFIKMRDNGYIVERNEKRPYCEKCGKFVVDTELEIKCPRCGNITKADNCDCGYVPDEKDLVGAVCRECRSETVLKENKVLVFKLTAFTEELLKHVSKNKDHWRVNAVNESLKYLKDFRDRDFSRDLEWGMKIPFEGYGSKKVYCWWEALLGYVTDSMRVCEEKGLNFDDFWKKTGNNRIYMVHAKDNIPFHTLLLPAMLMAVNENFEMPNFIVSSEYLTNAEGKISKSKGGFEALPFASEFNTDSIRYYMIANGPEKRDSNWSVELFKTVHNTEVVNKLGNLVNRTLKFKGLEELPKGQIDEGVRLAVRECYTKVSEAIESIEFKKAIETVMELVSLGNKFYDERQPWVQAKQENKTGFNDTIVSCAYIIANLSNLLEPFMPKTAKKLREFLGLKNLPEWREIEVDAGVKLNLVEALFVRY